MNLFNHASTNRRSFLRTAATAGLATGAAALAGGLLKPIVAQAAAITDADILNFALNLEYLEAEYYLYATTGAGLESYFSTNVTSGTGKQGTTTVKTNPKVAFTSGGLIEAYANEITQDEANHVLFLRTALKGAGVRPVAKPDIDLLNSFNALAQAAGLGEAFDPFANEVNFLIGAFVFEDVGVTAYHGAARFVQNPEYLSAAAGILGVEAYHAGTVRAALLAQSRMSGGDTIVSTIQKISDTRDVLSGSKKDKDQGIEIEGAPNVVPTDENSLAYARTTSEVLKIVYGGDSKKGVFFPNGMNGTIKTA